MTIRMQFFSKSTQILRSWGLLAMVVKVPTCGYRLQFKARAKICLAEFQVALALGSPQNMVVVAQR